MTTPILLFAAGFGTRMGALTADKPKPMITVSGTTLIKHALTLCVDQAVGPKVVNLHYKAQVLRDHLADSGVIFSDETDAILETGGGLRNALGVLGGSPVLTLNTDAVWHGPNPIAALLAAWDPMMDALLMTIPVQNVHGHHGNGDFVRGPNGRLARGAGEVYSGLQIIRTEGLADIPETCFSMNVLWDKISARGGLYGVSYTGHWCDVGQPESIAIAENMIGSTSV